jgi:hypothetical protein
MDFMSDEEVTKMLEFQKRCKGYAARLLLNKQDRQDFVSFCMESFLIDPKITLNQNKWIMANFLRKYPLSIVRRNFRNKKNHVQESKHYYYEPTINGAKYIGIDHTYENNFYINAMAGIEVENIISKYYGSDRAILILSKKYGFNNKELSNIFGLHPSTLSLILKRLMNKGV